MLNLILLIVFSASASAENCIYSIIEDSSKVTWTGFKYTEKTGVSGTFNNIQVVSKPSQSLKQLLNTISFSVDTNSIDSGNSARDMTLKKTVFGYLKEPNTIKGMVATVESKRLNIKMTMNETMTTEFLYKFDPQTEKIVAQSTIDLTEYGLLKSYKAVAKACKALHTGEDGVSKTWTDVDLKLETQVKKECAEGFMDTVKGWFSS